MAQQRPAVRERGHRHPTGVAAAGGVEGCASEDTSEGAEMIQERRAIEETGTLREVAAYSNGWEDGRVGPTRLFFDNANLAGWAGHEERLAYYRGHRDGRRARGMPAEGQRTA